MNRIELIDYIIQHYLDCHPLKEEDITIVKQKQKKYNDEDLYRVANAIERFGLTTLEEVIKDDTV